ncbi:MAG: YIP1 family protein [Chloroflexi bacterium]|nr:MAG: YIP1 family protein [Chloroflexota bacterium]MBL1197416.1 YIP1 family protein [Chloroflexota bacterium]NOH14712.1 YIP1 family protein [Chloroflexota bacterium]
MSIPENTNLQEEQTIDEPNPWLSMWIRPRETIRHIVSTNPEHHIYFIAVLSGIYQALDNATDRSLGDTLPLVSILIFALVIGGFVGIIRLAIEGWLLGMVGNWFGGKSNSKEMRAAVAWSSLPSIILLIGFVPIILIFGRDWFTSTLPGIGLPAILMIGAFSLIIGIIGFVWRAFMLISSLVELHAFSAWRAIATIVVGYAIPTIPLLLLLFASEFLRG